MLSHSIDNLAEYRPLRTLMALFSFHAFSCWWKFGGHFVFLIFVHDLKAFRIFCFSWSFEISWWCLWDHFHSFNLMLKRALFQYKYPCSSSALKNWLLLFLWTLPFYLFCLSRTYIVWILSLLDPYCHFSLLSYFSVSLSFCLIFVEVSPIYFPNMAIKTLDKVLLTQKFKSVQM